MYLYKDEELQYYEKQLSKYKPFTCEEEKEIFARYKKGEDVIDEIIKHNLKLVVCIAKQYISYVKYTNFSFLDIIEYGNLGLINSIGRYDPSKGKKFSTYAAYWIRQSIIKSIRDYGYNLRLSTDLYNKRRKMDEAYDELYILLNREPTVEELAEAIKVSPKKILEIREMNKRQVTAESEPYELGLDKILSNNRDESEFIMTKFRNEFLYDILNNVKLTEIQYKILVLRYGLIDGKKKTCEEVAEICEISKQFVNQQEMKALKKIRESKYIYSLASYFDNSKEILRNIGKTDLEIENKIKKISRS